MKKLLIITQTVDVNDPILGFFYSWLVAFSREFEQVNVVCLRVGQYDLPNNVNVFSLGKERGFSKVRILFRFYKKVFSLRKDYDVVFVHMNPIYVVLCGLYWRLCKKKISLWYSHRSVDLKLKIATKLANVIFSTSKESFLVKTKKLVVTGHGIDTKIYNIFTKKNSSDILNLMCVGRITKIKNQDVLIDVCRHLHDVGIKNRVTFVGGPQNKTDEIYLNEIKRKIQEYDLTNDIIFLGNTSNDKMPKMYRQADATVNIAPQTGMDKVVLESLASSVPVFASNKAFLTFFGKYEDIFTFKDTDGQVLAQKIEKFFRMDNKTRDDMVEELKDKVQKEFDISSLITKIRINLESL